MAERIDELMSAGGDCCVAFTPRFNNWNGQQRVEMQVIDFKPGKVASLG
jgi:single-stranded-DNA-specific exonuclease